MNFLRANLARAELNVFPNLKLGKEDISYQYRGERLFKNNSEHLRLPLIKINGDFKQWPQRKVFLSLAVGIMLPSALQLVN